MFVSDVMTTNPVTIGPNDTVRLAIACMESIDCRRLPVLDDSGGLIGIITDRDVRLGLHSTYISHLSKPDNEILDSIKVRDCMTPAPVIVEPTTDIVQATSLMIRYHIGGLPVLLGESLVGILTATDVMSAFVRQFQGAKTHS